MHNIDILNVTKKYKNKTVALQDVSFSVESGVYGLLGHNGAGKTSLLKTIATILQPTAGTVLVCGYNTKKEGKEVRKRIGYLPQELLMYPSLTAIDFVSYMAKLKGVRNMQEVEKAIEQVGMTKFLNCKIGQMSGGMKRRIGIAQAMVGQPPVLIVDEPTTGLDPEERVRFRGVLSRYAKDGNTVILSTHIIEDVHQLCTKLAVLRTGKLFFQGTTNQLIKQVEGKVKLVNLKTEQELADIQKKAAVISVSYQGNALAVRFADEKDCFKNIAPVPATLEDAYMYCMGGKASV